MDTIALARSAATSVTCPSWCGAEHAPGDPVRVHEGAATAFAALVDGGSAERSVEARLTRTDEDGTTGATAVGLDDLELAPDAARRLGLALIEHADRAERAPRGGGVPRFRGRLVLPRGLHDVICSWRIGSRDDERAHVAWCAGCGNGVAIGEGSA